MQLRQSGVHTMTSNRHAKEVIKKLLQPEIKHHLRQRFSLDWRGIHGMPHWWRVLSNGVWIAQQERADVELVAWFALLHDHCREDDEADPLHGARAADETKRLVRSGRLVLEASRCAVLLEAIRHHTDGGTNPDPTIGSCWDADRLDLPRVGIEPKARFLSTASAKSVLVERSKSGATSLQVFDDPKEGCAPQ